MAVAGVGGVQVLGQVRGAHHDAAQARAGADDLLGVKHAERGLHHGPDGDLPGRRGVGHRGLDLAHHVRAFDLGDQHRVGAAGARHDQVLVAPRRGQRVDADDQLAVAVAAGLDSLLDVDARLDLGVGGDRVLQVEDQPVGRQAAALFQGSGVGARHVKHAAPGPVGPGHNPNPRQVYPSKFGWRL